MSRGIILYQSKYGATKKYVDWLVEELGYDYAETKNAKVADLLNYDVIILGGGVYASGIAGLQFLKKNIGQLTDKKIAVFAVGASPYDEKAIQQVRELHFKDTLSNIPLFYCRGAWDEEKMKVTDRTLCKMLQKAVAKQNPNEYEPWQKALMCAVGQKCDWTDKSYLEPLLKYIEEVQFDVKVEGGAYGLKITKPGIFKDNLGKVHASVCPECGYLKFYLEDTAKIKKQTNFSLPVRLKAQMNLNLMRCNYGKNCNSK